MPQNLIEDFFARRTRDSIGKINSPKQELTFEQLKIFYEENEFQLNEHFLNNLELLTEEDKYNYVAYLFSDINSTSIKVAKYNGNDRYDLIENNEYGYCSIVKATKKQNGGLNGGLKLLFEVIRNNPGIKIKDTSTLLNNRPVSTSEKQIRELIKQGLVERQGSKRSGGYYAVE